MEDALARNVCRLVAGIIVSDDDLDDAEDAFLDRLLERFGIPAEDRAALFPIVDASEAAESIRELPADVQREAFDLLVAAVAADGKVVAAERAYVDAVAGAIGLPAADVDAKLSDALGR